MDRKSLIITMSVLLGLNSAILADYLGVHIPLARQIFGFIALTFFPGYLLLKIFRTRLESFSEKIFLSVALSISVVMLMGIFANFVYPLLGVEKPITLLPILLTFNVVTLGLLAVEQARTVPMLNTRRQIRIAKWDLFFALLPVWSLIGAYLFSHYGDNSGLLLLYFVIALTPLVFLKSKNFNRTFAIWSIAISLMWSTVFGVSWNYIWGYDINGEYYYANLVLARGIWSISTYDQYNTIASVNILGPVYSLILNMWIVPIFKIIYPLVFSLVPVILLKAYERLLGNKIWAELSVLFFMFFFQFFVSNMALARMMIVEVYLALLAYATIRKINPLFLILFLASLAVSHYGTAYLTMFALLTLPLIRVLENEQRISNKLIAVFWVVTLLWYAYVGGGFQFNNLVIIGYQTLLMLKDLFNPQYSQGLELIVAKMTFMREIAKLINLFAQGLISIGVLTVLNRLIRGRKVKHLEFYALSFAFFAYDIAGIVVPYFSNRMNVNRLYHLTQFFIAPYLLIGFDSVKRIMNNLSKNRHTLPLKNSVEIAGVFLVVYFIFTSGWTLVIANDPKPPMWLEKVDGPYWSLSEISGGKWIAEYRYDSLKIYSDQYRALLFLGLINQNINEVSFRGEEKISNFPKREAYAYLGKTSVREKKILVINQKYLGTIKEFYYLPIYNKSIFEGLWTSNKIYSSQDVAIYKI
ncbi:DUF2206 domain-containing protein [Pyrococcus abyssi]|uniref:DUF2206 domain-containing protein n=1 Tax=Pyrococcus abyssi (strain GE5 / Orsay) TaxID=272844 RepID=Q9UZG1_PYRAB|nr:DUF2206 domain-containing protein [Pyrococcus abyssi]CAB50098.1 Hypothetical protein PAB1590 [Pyrococcus abyssi GE5]CCE70618.1 TPA: hypothetical protein PAB1590 [Pyrococcus abyssi GE5]